LQYNRTNLTLIQILFIKLSIKLLIVQCGHIFRISFFKIMVIAPHSCASIL